MPVQLQDEYVETLAEDHAEGFELVTQLSRVTDAAYQPRCIVPSAA